MMINISDLLVALLFQQTSQELNETEVKYNINKTMNENINLVKILKDTPKGTKLWSPMFGECEFIKILSVGICQIQVKHTEGNTYHFYNFTPEGKFSNDFEAECLLFPSKDNRDWTTFKAHLKHKHFEPFQRILVADNFDI